MKSINKEKCMQMQQQCYSMKFIGKFLGNSHIYANLFEVSCQYSLVVFWKNRKDAHTIYKCMYLHVYIMCVCMFNCNCMWLNEILRSSNITKYIYICMYIIGAYVLLIVRLIWMHNKKHTVKSIIRTLLLLFHI